MNQLWRRGLCLLLASVLLLAGCGKKDKEQSGEKEAVQGFLDGLVSADREAIDAWSTGNILDSEILQPCDPAAFEERIYENFNVDREGLETDAQEKVTEYCGEIAKSYVTDYKIGEIREEDGGAVAETVVTFGYDMEEVLEGKELEEGIEKTILSYQDENVDQILENYLSGGQSAMMQRIYNDLLPDILKLIGTTVKNSDPIKREIELRVEKSGEDWKVTEAKVD